MGCAGPAFCGLMSVVSKWRATGDFAAGKSETLQSQGTCTRGVSRISARGVLKVRPHTKSGGGGGGNSLQVRYEKWGGGGGGGAVRFKAPFAPPPPPGSYASETVTILTKRVLKHFANELICRF